MWRSVFRGILVAVAVICLFVGAVVLPVLPGYLNWTHAGESESPLALQPQTFGFVHSTKNQSVTYFFNLTVTLSFPDGGTHSVGNPMLMNVSMKLPEDIFLYFSFGLIDVAADGAAWYSYNPGALPAPISAEFPSSNSISCIHASNASIAFSPKQVRFLLPNKGYVYDPNQGAWVELLTESVLLDYPAPGQFDLTASFYNSTTSGQYCGFTLHTSSFVPVLSQETVDTERNNAYTLGLALFVLMFAAIQVCIELKPKPPASTNQLPETEPPPSVTKKKGR